MSFRKLDALPFVSSLLLAAGFTNYAWGWLSLVALLPYFFWLEKSTSQKPLPRRKIILLTWLAGWLFFLINLGWWLFTQPELWSGISTTTARVGQYLTWFISALVFS